ncbi:MAG: L,D-transpeptidase family protein [Nanoarchaeota archaeon]|nr:L,D-transpeptidase family protein [Nanoarchaeota archaeon]
MKLKQIVLSCVMAACSFDAEGLYSESFEFEKPKRTLYENAKEPLPELEPITIKLYNNPFSEGLEKTKTEYEKICRYHKIYYSHRDKKETIAKIQDNLVVLGYLNQESFKRGELSQTTISAIQGYKRANGIKKTGKISRRFIRHINIPIKKRIKMLETALKLSEGLKASDYQVIVNIPEFKMRFYAHHLLVHQDDTCVGARYDHGKWSKKWRTDIQKGKIIKVRVNPIWHIPSSISSRLGYKDKKWLKKRGYYWKRNRWRQRPGLNNTLGRIAFPFKSNYGELLHGTPNKKVFQKNIRAFSHGCMRLKDEISFFKVLQKEGLIKNYNLEVLLKAKKGRYINKKIKLIKPIKVNVIYMLASAIKIDDKWAAVFPKDIYRLRKSKIKKGH